MKRKKVFLISIQIFIIFIFLIVFPIREIAFAGTPIPTDPSWTIIDETTINAKTSLNTVINDLVKNGNKKVYIKDGIYNLSGSIIINQSNIIIQGQSKENTKIIQTDSGSNSIEVRDTYSVQVSDLNIDNSIGKIAFLCQNSNDIVLKNCIINGSSANSAIAFWGKQCADEIAAVENGDLDDSNIIDGNKVYSDFSNLNAEDSIVFTKQKNGIIRNNTISGGRIAFYLSRNSEVSDNIIKDSQTNGIRYTVPAYDNKIIHNYIENTKASGIAAFRNSTNITLATYRATGLEVSNNTINNSRYFGIEIGNLKGAIIKNNKLNQIDFSGIYLLYCDDLDIGNNQIYDCGISRLKGNLWGWNENLNSGIFGDYTVANSSIYSNEITNLNDSNQDCPFGVRIQADDINHDNKVTNNTITGYFEYGTSIRTGAPVYNIDSPNTINLKLKLSPQNIKTESTLNDIKVSWDAVTKISEYVIEVDGVTIDNGSNTSYIHSGLISDTSHKYRVKAKGGQWSNIVDADTLTLPVATNIKTVSTVNDIKVSWDAVAGASEYVIEVDGVIIDNGSNTSYIHSGLISDTSHKYRVKAKGGQWSNIVDADTLTLPGATNIKTVSTVNDIKVSWDAVAGASEYVIEVDGVTIDNGSNTSYIHSGLISDTSHKYRVKAKGGQWSNIVDADTLTLPVATNIKTVSTVNDIKVSWDAVAGASEYVIEVDGVIIDNGSNTSYIHSGLISDTSHKYRVKAKGGQWSNIVDADTLTLPVATNIKTVSTVNDIKVSWDAVAGASEYVIEVDGVIIDNGSNTSYIHSGLISDTSHKYRVKAKGGQWSNIVNADTLALPVATSIEVNDIEVTENQSKNLNAVVKDQFNNVINSGYTLKYSIGNINIADVNSSGEITAKKYVQGVNTTTVTIMVEGTSVTKTINITVKKEKIIPPASIATSIEVNDIEVTENQSKNLNAVVKDQFNNVINSGYTLKYSIGNINIADVNSSGEITAKKYVQGVNTTTVTIMVEGTSVTKTINITVKKEIIIPPASVATSIEVNDIEVTENQMKNLNAVVKDQFNNVINSGYTLKYNIDNENIADVDSSEEITAKNNDSLTDEKEKKSDYETIEENSEKSFELQKTIKMKVVFGFIGIIVLIMIFLKLKKISKCKNKIVN